MPCVAQGSSTIENHMVPASGVSSPWLVHQSGGGIPLGSRRYTQVYYVIHNLSIIVLKGVYYNGRDNPCLKYYPVHQ